MKAQPRREKEDDLSSEHSQDLTFDRESSSLPLLLDKFIQYTKLKSKQSVEPIDAKKGSKKKSLEVTAEEEKTARKDANESEKEYEEDDEAEESEEETDNSASASDSEYTDRSGNDNDDDEEDLYNMTPTRGFQAAINNNSSNKPVRL